MDYLQKSLVFEIVDLQIALEFLQKKKKRVKMKVRSLSNFKQVKYVHKKYQHQQMSVGFDVVCCFSEKVPLKKVTCRYQINLSFVFGNEDSNQ